MGRWVTLSFFGSRCVSSSLFRDISQGSYGGMLAAWLRMKYPTSVIGAIASSAPIWYFLDQVPCNQFYEKVTDVFQTYGGDECVDVIKMSWKMIRNISRGEKGR
ncbi:unnamed protein product [Callosobruchus maculatus]|uniref:Uncharacterized protein n=1 Tax=Callosobruchus maculatus TaxID=64391 RepID=A0A653DND7_CALMS|nr:unnamed protein product [Callosobruchus maculatus]